MAKVTLPKGYQTISGFANSWKPDKKGASLQGVLVAIKKVTVERKRGKKTVKEDVNKYTFRTLTGDVDVWESAGLRSLQQVKKGQSVFIQFIGKRIITKGQNPMREFLVAVK